MPVPYNANLIAIDDDIANCTATIIQTKEAAASCMGKSITSEVRTEEEFSEYLAYYDADRRLTLLRTMRLGCEVGLGTTRIESALVQLQAK